jgi:hypothetical protein
MYARFQIATKLITKSSFKNIFQNNAIQSQNSSEMTKHVFLTMITHHLWHNEKLFHGRVAFHSTTRNICKAIQDIMSYITIPNSYQSSCK